ncbi:hypothetical protein BTS2_3414 [Bacillus sp. TS-2]|nr:hypothetical protein BTS2_3414 [Bacillus sp. TS-2]
MPPQIHKGDELLRGAFILSLAAIVAKVMSAAYRIPYQNIAGDLGFYVYQQIYPFYGLMVTLSIFGFPVVLSRNIAQYEAKNERKKAQAYSSVVFYTLLLLSIFATVLFYLGAPFIAKIIGDVQLIDPLRAVGLSYLLIPFLSIFRGVHQGQQNMLPTAISQVIEQFIRVLAILLLAFLFLSWGYGPYGAGIGAAYGSIVGGVVAIIVLFFTKKTGWISWLRIHATIYTGMFKDMFQFLSQSLYICIGAMTFIFFQLIDVFSMVRLLELYGLASVEAFYQKALYDRGQPLLQLGTIVTTTFSLALVPLLTSAKANGHFKEMFFYRHLTLKLTILIGGAATVGLIVIMEPLNSMLFSDRMGSSILKVFVLSIFVSAIYMTSASILQGKGLIHLPAIAVVMGLILKSLFNVLFVPLSGAMGAAIATVLAFTVMACSMLYFLRKDENGARTPFKPYGFIAMILFLLFVFTSLWMNFVERFLEYSRMSDMLLSISTVFFGVIIVLLLIRVLPVFDEDEWKVIPILKKWKRVK